LVVKPRGSQIDFPLSRHGQGMQSLAVMFLFQAYIDILLKPTFEPETEALLALEEPEAHLHPHAARAFARSLGQLSSQKIISSHSPYFIQEIPFKAIRMFRRNGATTKVLFVRDTFSIQLPPVTGLVDFCNRSGGKFEYHPGRQELHVRGKVEQTEYRALLTIYANNRETHGTLRKLSEESQLFLTDGELTDLETYAKRIRGEVLFARGWLLCEGQSEYLLVRYFAELLGKQLDQCGISVIDFQNNGSPGTFVALARAFEIPWIMFCDNDPEGVKFVNQVQARGVTGAELAARVRPLPGAGMDLETFLAKNGFLQEYEEIATARGWPISTKRGDAGHEEEIAKAVKSDKTGTMLQLLEKLRGKGMSDTGIPGFFKTLLDDLTKEVS